MARWETFEADASELAAALRRPGRARQPNGRAVEAQAATHMEPGALRSGRCTYWQVPNRGDKPFQIIAARAAA